MREKGIPMKLLEDVKQYKPWNEQEERDQSVMVDFIQHAENVLLRENRLAHFTASSWIVNKDRTKILLAFHNIYKSWSWTGGHADGEEDLLAVAVREAQEETGLIHVVPVSPDIFSLEIVTVDGHRKRGKYVSSHLHINVTYLLEADEEEMLRIKEDENSNVAWFPIEEAVAASCEPWMQIIYQKLNDKLWSKQGETENGYD